MRTLLAPPDSVLDPVTRQPRFGSFRGPLPPVNLGPLGRGALFRLARHKRWLWGVIVDDKLLLGFAVVDVGYAASAFAYALGRAERHLLADHAMLGPPFCGSVGDHPEDGCQARFARGRDVLRIRRRTGSPIYEIELDVDELHVEAQLSTAGAPTPISAIVELERRGVGTTQKRTLLTASGRATVGGRRFALDGALGGLDYSHGYPPRRTLWKWCFLLGHATSGEPIGLNLVQGFVGESECGVWVGSELFPLAEGRFELDRSDPLVPWRIRTADDAVQLEFLPDGLHRESKNLGLIRSDFVQVAGRFRGTIAVEGRAPLRLEDVPGVAEDQDMLW